MINIKGIDKADLLIALYNASKPQGMGLYQAAPRGGAPLTRREAQSIIDAGFFIDYLLGRVMKVDLTGDSFDERLYDRDNGQGAAMKAISHLLRNN